MNTQGGLEKTSEGRKDRQMPPNDPSRDKSPPLSCPAWKPRPGINRKQSTLRGVSSSGTPGALAVGLSLPAAKASLGRSAKRAEEGKGIRRGLWIQGALGLQICSLKGFMGVSSRKQISPLTLAEAFSPVTSFFIQANKETIAHRGVRRAVRCCSGEK